MATNTPDFITVSPPGLTFPVYKVNQRQPLTIKNLTGEKIIYKIKTTAPNRYQVRPTQGTLEPHEEVRCVVMLRAPEADEPIADARHRFLIQAMPAPRDTTEIQTLEDLGTYWKTQERLKAPYQQLRILSLLVVPQGDEPVPNTENVTIAPDMGASAVVTDDSDQPTGPVASGADIASPTSGRAAQTPASDASRPVRVSISAASEAAEAAAAAAVASQTSPAAGATEGPESEWDRNGFPQAAGTEGAKNGQSFELKYRGMLAYSLMQVQKVKTLESKLEAVQSEAERLRVQDESLRKEIGNLTSALETARKTAGAAHPTKDGASGSKDADRSGHAGETTSGLKREFVLAMWQLLLILAVGMFLGKTFARNKCPSLDGK